MDWRGGRSVPRRCSSPHASRHASCAALRWTKAGWMHRALPNLRMLGNPSRYPSSVGSNLKGVKSRPWAFHFGLATCLFHLCERLRYFPDVGPHGNVVLLEPGHLAGLIHDRNGPPSDPLILDVHAVLAGHGPARI